MMQLTQEERMILTHRVVYMLTRSKKDYSWNDVLSMTYCEFIPDAEKEHGNLITEHILHTMNQYETMKDVYVQEPKAFSRYYTDAITEGKSLEQQCRNLHCMITGLEAFDEVISSGQIDPEKEVSKQIKQCQKQLKKEKLSYNGPFTKEARDALKQQAEHLISDSGMSFLNLDKSIAILNESYDKADQILRYRLGEQMFRSVTAMVMYTMVKNGELSMVPENATAEQITLAVCAEDSIRQLVSDMEDGYVDSETYKKRKMAYWRAYQVLIVGGFLLIGGAGVSAALAAEKTVEAVVAGAACLYGIYIALGPMNESTKKLIEVDAACLEFKSDLRYETTAEEILGDYTKPEGDEYITEDDSVEDQEQEFEEEIEFV